MLCLSGNSPCLNGGACTDGIGQYTCACAAGFCGPTCADPAQPNGQCPCADDPSWTDVMQSRGPCSSFATDREYYCSHGADAAGVTAAVACPVSCQSGCALTYDDCCEISHTCFHQALRQSVPKQTASPPKSALRLCHASKFSLNSPSFSIFLSHFSHFFQFSIVYLCLVSCLWHFSHIFLTSTFLYRYAIVLPFFSHICDVIPQGTAHASTVVPVQTTSARTPATATVPGSAA